MIGYRLATAEDIGRIRDFIRLHWRADHIFVRDDAFFRSEMAALGAPQFLLAEDGDALIGLVGFVQTTEELGHADLFLVLLRALAGYAAQGVGLKLLQACKELTTRSVHTVGANPRALPLYSLVGFRTGFLDQFIWVNPRVERFRILADVLGSGWTLPGRADHVRSLDARALEPVFAGLDQGGGPTKSWWYVRKRYFEHPVYRYDVLGVFDGPGAVAPSGLGVIRLQEHDGARLIRIVDWLGAVDGLAPFLEAVKARCLELGCEGIDLYCTGLPTELIGKAGFRPAEGNAVFPNYFSPFLAENVRISFATTSPVPIRLMRGDGDQDRPS